jgi:hypothetical protein
MHEIKLYNIPLLTCLNVPHPIHGKIDAKRWDMRNKSGRSSTSTQHPPNRKVVRDEKGGPDNMVH